MIPNFFLDSMITEIKNKPELSINDKSALTRKANREAVGNSVRHLLVLPEKLLRDFKTEVVDVEIYSSINEAIRQSMREKIENTKRQYS